MKLTKLVNIYGAGLLDLHFWKQFLQYYSMKIILNGNPFEIEEPATIKDLILKLGLDKRPYAVELNRKVISKKLHHEVKLSEGDRVEIVHFVGGG